MAYIECPKCRQRALSVATRCPHCGHSFPTEFIQHPVSEPQLPKLRPGLVIAGALAAVAVVVVIVQHRAGSKTVTIPPEAALVDSAPSIPAQPPPDTPAPVGDTSVATAPLPSVVPPPLAPQLQRYTTTWVNVRGGRSRAAPAVRVLRPGQAVLVDSLRRGWYRVLVNGRTLGYVHRLNLGTVAPAGRP